MGKNLRLIVPALLLVSCIAFLPGANQNPSHGTATSPEKSAPADNQGGNDVNPAQIQAAVDKALEYLAKNSGGNWHTSYATPGRVVIAAVSGLSYMASGSTLTQGKYSSAIKNALGYVRGNMYNPGFPKAAPGAPNYNQVNWSLSIGGMFIAEICMSDDQPKLKEELKKISELIQENQEVSGGWGHGPGGPNALNYVELNVMANWCLATLGIADQMGIEFDKQKVNAAVKYIMACSPTGGVGYSDRPGHTSGCPARTGGTIFAFDMLRATDNPFFKAMVSFVNSELPFLLTKPAYCHASPEMGMLQCGLGALHSGDEKLWNKFVQLYFPKILAAQNPDGTFKIINNINEPVMDGDLGPLYPTAMYSLTLQLAQAKLNFIGNGCTPCDMKNTYSTYKCPACNKILFGYYCGKCKKMLPANTIKGSKKCPTCSGDIETTSLLTNDKCFFCGQPVDKSKSAVKICIKEVYTCPIHSKERHLKPGKCQKKIDPPDNAPANNKDKPDTKNKDIKRCDQPLELAEINVSEIETVYVCSKCHSVKNTPGTCCNQPTAKEQICQESGTFPHVNAKDWEDYLKKKNK